MFAQNGALDTPLWGIKSSFRNTIIDINIIIYHIVLITSKVHSDDSIGIWIVVWLGSLHNAVSLLVDLALNQSLKSLWVVE